MLNAITTNQVVLWMLGALALFFVLAIVITIRGVFRRKKLEKLQIERMRHFLTTHSILLHERRKVQKS